MRRCRVPTQVRLIGAACLFSLGALAHLSAQQAVLPQDIFGQLAIGVNTRIGTRFGSDLSGSIEGMVGTHRAFRSWYRPSALSGGVTRLFANRCVVQSIGDCLGAERAIPWLAVLTGFSKKGGYGELRIMGGLGAAYVRGTIVSSSGLVPVFETRVDYLTYPTKRTGAVVFLRNLTVTNRNATQANGLALGIGIAER